MDGVFDWIEDNLGFLLAGVVILLFVALCYLAVVGEEQWQREAAERGCRETGRIESSTAFSGKGDTVFVPGKKIFTCRDGGTVIR